MREKAPFRLEEGLINVSEVWLSRKRLREV
jgi:hypothetical protein